MNQPIPWEKQDDELLEKYADEMMTSPKIASLLTEQTGRRRTKNAVIGRCYRKGIRLHGTSYDGANASKVTAAARRIENQKKKEERERLKAEKLAARAAKPRKTVVKEQYIDLGPVVKKEKLPPPPAIELDESKFVGIQRLNSRTCRYPVRNITSSSFLFCGATPEASSPYCKAHADVCFQPARPKK